MAIYPSWLFLPKNWSNWNTGIGCAGKAGSTFLAGKQEFIRLGLLDGVDMVLMFHLQQSDPVQKISVGATMNGCLAKFIRYQGKESHAGGAPHLGINALNAALWG